MQIQSNLPTQYFEYPINGSLMSYATKWTQTWDDSVCLTSSHYHPHSELGLCTEGCGVFFVEDRVYPFSQGTVIYIPADMPHIEENSPKHLSSWKYLWIDKMLFGERSAFDIFPCEVVTQDCSCRRLFDMIFNEVSEDQNDLILYKSLCTGFAHMMLRTLFVDRKPTDNEARQKIAPAVTYIAEHYCSDDITISKLASESHLSESTFRRAFFRATGLAPYEYICSVRLAAAENLLLHTDISILEISSACGFNSLSSFNRQFKKANGITPSFFRARNGLNN